MRPMILSVFLGAALTFATSACGGGDEEVMEVEPEETTGEEMEIETEEGEIEMETEEGEIEMETEDY